MKKLLATGRTDLLTGFISKKGRRFKAFLVKTPDGKVGFDSSRGRKSPLQRELHHPRKNRRRRSAALPRRPGS